MYMISPLTNLATTGHCDAEHGSPMTAHIRLSKPPPLPRLRILADRACIPPLAFVDHMPHWDGSIIPQVPHHWVGVCDTIIRTRPIQTLIQRRQSDDSPFIGLGRRERAGMSDQTSFGYWIRRRRKALHLTQADLARRV